MLYPRFAAMSSIATRATLFRMFPYVSFLFLFAAFTPERPLFLYDKYLESNLAYQGASCAIRSRGGGRWRSSR